MWIEKEFENFYVCQKLFFSACHTPYQKGDFRELTKNCIGRSLEIRYLSIIQHISEFDVLPLLSLFWPPWFSNRGFIFSSAPCSNKSKMIQIFQMFNCSMKFLSSKWRFLEVPLSRRSFLEISSQLFDVISSIRTLWNEVNPSTSEVIRNESGSSSGRPRWIFVPT